MYDRLGEVERQHKNSYKMNPYGATLHPRDIEWLIEQAKNVEHLVRENNLLREKLTKLCPHKNIEDGSYTSNPPKKRCLDCGKFFTA